MLSRVNRPTEVYAPKLWRSQISFGTVTFSISPMPEVDLTAEARQILLDPCGASSATGRDADHFWASTRKALRRFSEG